MAVAGMVVGLLCQWPEAEDDQHVACVRQSVNDKAKSMNGASIYKMISDRGGHFQHSIELNRAYQLIVFCDIVFADIDVKVCAK